MIESVNACKTEGILKFIVAVLQLLMQSFFTKDCFQILYCNLFNRLTPIRLPFVKLTFTLKHLLHGQIVANIPVYNVIHY